MKGFSIFLVIVLFFAGLYFGIIYLVKNAHESQPTTDVSEATSAWQTQSQKTSELQDQQRELMRQRQEHMRDLGHR